jgi:hypothetical protein
MRFTLAWISLLTGLLLAAPALADDDSDRGRDRGPVYEVTVTNVTKGQTFTPILVATHSPGVELFQVGESASRQLEILAEDGNTGPLADALADQGRRVGDVTTIDGLLDPGLTAKVRVRASRRHSRISLAAMLIPTNDTFFAVNGARLPHFGANTLGAPGYDAGTEENDQDCANIPGRARSAAARASPRSRAPETRASSSSATASTSSTRTTTASLARSPTTGETQSLG